MSLNLANREIGRADVTSGFQDPSSHSFDVVVDREGKQGFSVAFLNDFYQPQRELDRNLTVISVSVRGPFFRNDVPEYMRLIARRSEIRNQRVATRFIEEFGQRAWRRPLSDDEIKRHVDLYAATRKQGASFYESVRVVLQAFLVSPNFLYKIEEPVGEGKTRWLNDYELAASSSYFLWSSMPDDELLAEARENKLSDPLRYRLQVRRLLESERSRALIENFAAQWLQLRLLRDHRPEMSKFPLADQQLLEDMITETKMLVADIFRRDGSILELLRADYTFLNQRLAAHYGIERVEGNAFEKVQLRGDRRLGLLTQASILTLTSNPNRTSPVKRGKWIMENLLAEEVPPALPDIVPLDQQTELQGTLRQRMEQHRADPSCASCHRTMDALGFALENYDAIGRWRSEDDGIEIDATGELPDGTKFTGAVGLQHALENAFREQFLQCFTEKLLIYALGRGLEYYDLCTVDAIIREASQSDFRVSSFILGVAESVPFRQRRDVE
jgi:hypothetical protein